MKAHKTTTKKKVAKAPRKAGKDDDAQPDLLEMVGDSLQAVGRVKDAKTTIKEFERIKFPAPREYGPADIVKLRERKLRMSQAAFAVVCNAKLSTLQKWESGINKPTPPINRLFQIIERGGLAFLQGR
jgi:putative transcriptional regulator